MLNVHCRQGEILRKKEHFDPDVHLNMSGSMRC